MTDSFIEWEITTSRLEWESDVARLLNDVREMGKGEIRTSRVDFTKELSDGETLTGTPTVSLATNDSGALTFGNIGLASSYINRHGETVASNRAVEFSITAVRKGTFKVLISVSTNGSPSQTLKLQVQVQVV